MSFSERKKKKRKNIKFIFYHTFLTEDIENRKLLKNLKSLGDMKIFSNWTNKKLKSLMLRFIEKTYEKQAFVYKENEKADGIYLIQQGEFVVSDQNK